MTKKGHVASEQELAQKRAWYAENRERERKKQRDYSAANKVAAADRQRKTGPAYYAANKETFQKAGKRFRDRVKVERPWFYSLRCAKSRATERGLAFELSEDWCRSVWTGLCAISGLPFRPDMSGKPGPKPFSPTIDRVDQQQGYVPSNCRFVLCCVNNFRGTLGDADMLSVASAIVLCGGGSTIEVSERFTSQVCSECGSLPTSRPRGIADLGKRAWRCDDCGTNHDRDVNAARNILRVGLDTLRRGASL